MILPIAFIVTIAVKGNFHSVSAFRFCCFLDCLFSIWFYQNITDACRKLWRMRNAWWRRSGWTTAWCRRRCCRHGRRCIFLSCLLAKNPAKTRWVNVCCARLLFVGVGFFVLFCLSSFFVSIFVPWSWKVPSVEVDDNFMYVWSSGMQRFAQSEGRFCVCSCLPRHAVSFTVNTCKLFTEDAYF